MKRIGGLCVCVLLKKEKKKQVQVPLMLHVYDDRFADA